MFESGPFAVLGWPFGRTTAVAGVGVVFKGKEAESVGPLVQ